MQPILIPDRHIPTFCHVGTLWRHPGRHALTSLGEGLPPTRLILILILQILGLTNQLQYRVKGTQVDLKCSLFHINMLLKRGRHIILRCYSNSLMNKMGRTVRTVRPRVAVLQVGCFLSPLATLTHGLVAVLFYTTIIDQAGTHFSSRKRNFAFGPQREERTLACTQECTQRMRGLFKYSLKLYIHRTQKCDSQHSDSNLTHTKDERQWLK